MPKGVRLGGRQKGTKNKLTVDIRALAMPHTERAIAVLVELLESDRADVRAKAASELLDRAHGKPSQAQIHQGDPNCPIEFRLSFKSGI